MKLKIPDMSCGHCAGVITKAIKAVDPAADVKIDLASKIVGITTTAPNSSIATALENAGYPSSSA